MPNKLMKLSTLIVSLSSGEYLMPTAEAGGRVSVRISSYTSIAERNRTYDVTVQIKFSGDDNDGPWQVTDLDLREADIAGVYQNIQQINNALVIRSLDTWYSYTFRSVNPTRYEDFGDGVELFAWAEVNDNDFGFNPDAASPEYKIKVLSSKATSASPSHRATGRSRNTDLSWSNGGGATSYDVYFGTDASPDSGERKSAGTRSRSYNLNTLEYDTRYYWRIDSKNYAGTKEGDVWYFNTEDSPRPEKARSPSPSHRATGRSRNTDLSWSNGGRATSYDVYFGTDSSPDSGERKTTDTRSRSYNLSTLEYGTRYYWRIDSKNSGGTTQGDVWSFTTESAPSKPDLIIRDITFDPSSPVAGERVKITARSYNRGNGRSNSFNIEYKVDGTRIGTDSEPAFDAGIESTENTYHRFPSAGSYRISVVADYDGRISESDESNNERTETLQVLPQPVQNYTLAVTRGSGDGSYPSGRQVTISANTPSSGQVFNRWTVSPSQYASSLGSATAARTTFTMPAAAVTLTATYRTAPAQQYTLTVTGGSGGGSYATGASVPITANAPPSGQVFNRWTVSPSQYVSSLGSATAASTTFTMPAAAVTLTATYRNAGGGSDTQISVVETSAAPRSSVEVPIQLVASGLEEGFQFTVSFNPAELTFQSFLAASTPNVIVNSNEMASGKIGALLSSNTGSTYPSGTQELARVSFDIIGGSSGDRIAVGFADSPISRLVAPSSIVPSWSDGVILISAGLEADVMPRSAPDEKVNLFDWIQVGRFAAKLDDVSNSLEFQKADCAPKTERGNGTINLFDWIQAGRYAALLDSTQAAGGPSSVAQASQVANSNVGTEKAMPVRYAVAAEVEARQTTSPTEIFVENISAEAGSVVTAAVYLVASGIENAASFSLSNANLVYITNSVLGGLPITKIITPSEGRGGIIGITGVNLALSSGQTFPAGTNGLVNLHYTVKPDARPGSTVLAFTNVPINLLVGDVNGPIPDTPTFTDGVLTVTGDGTAPRWKVEPGSAQHTGVAESGSFSVTQEVGADAPWVAALLPNAQGWVTLTPGHTSGTGGGEVRYAVSTNMTGVARSGTIQVQNALFMVNQAVLPPAAPSNPDPADGAADVARAVTLGWDAAAFAAGYEVRFGTNAAALRTVARLGSTRYNTGLRAAGERFVWEVTATNEAGMATGGPWSFTTEDVQTPDEVFGRDGTEWSYAGSAPWFAQTNVVRSGERALQSGAAGDDETSTLEAKLVGPGILDFWWRTDSEENADYLNCYLGTGLVAFLSGSSANWTNETVSIPSGEQTVRWSYEKDASDASGADAGWLDDVQWQGENRTTYPLSGFAGNWAAAYLWDYAATNWIVVNHPVQSPTEVTVRNLRPTRWYWLCVMEYDGSNWNLAHGSWISHLNEEIDLDEEELNSEPEM